MIIYTLMSVHLSAPQCQRLEGELEIVNLLQMFQGLNLMHTDSLGLRGIKGRWVMGG